MKRILTFALLAAVLPRMAMAGTGVPGLYQKIYSGSNVTKGDPADGGDIITAGASFLALNYNNPSFSFTDPETGTTYTLGGSQTVGYKGAMRMTAGTTYTFVKNFDDNGHIWIISPDGTTTNKVVDSTTYNAVAYGSFTPTETDYHTLLIYYGNGSGNVGPTTSPFTSKPYASLLWNDAGLTECTKENRSQWHRLLNNDDSLGRYLFTDVPDEDWPVVSNITASVASDGKATVSFLLGEGKGDISVQLIDSDENVSSVEVGKGISASETVLSGTVSGLEAGRSYTVNVHVETTAGMEYDFDGGAVYMGDVSIAAGTNAESATLTPGTFVISRPADDEATRFPLTVGFTCSGATPGTHYGELSGKATIPAGASSVTVKVWPLQYGEGDHDLTLTLTSGLNYCVGTAASAAITILGSEIVRQLRFVSTNGSDANSGCSMDLAFRSLEYALEQVASMESVTILVEPGLYETTYRTSVSGLGNTHYVITNAVTVLGLGSKPEDTHFKGTGNGSNYSRIFFLDHADAKIKNLLVSCGYNGYDEGGGNIRIYSNGGTVEDCVISNGMSCSYCNGGGGVLMKAGRVLRSKFTDNSGNNQEYGSVGAHLVQAGGYVENCLFTRADKSSTRKSFALIHLSGSAVMSSCTIAGNHCNANASVYLSGNKCRVYNCAIFGNSVDSDSTGHASVYTLSGAKASQFVNCAADREINDSCIYAESAGFVDEATYDFHLGGTSVCLDAGDETLYVAPQVTSATDLDGNLRLTGSKRGTKLDIGCYEFDTSGLSLDVTVDEPVGLMEYDGGLKPVTASFHAVKSGGSGAITYYWDFNGDGTTDLETSEEDVIHEYTAIGVYTVILKATDDSGSASITKTAFYSVGPKTIYVDAASANPTAPYATRATAAKTVSAAYDAAYDGATILVEPGVYLYSDQAKRLDIAKAIAILGAGDAPEDAIFTNEVYSVSNYGNGSFFRVMADGALVANMMFVDGFDYSLEDGGGITVNAGVVSNCVFRHCGGTGAKGGGAVVNGGLLTHSLCENCYITNFAGAKFQGAYIGGTGRIENSLFRNLHSNSSIVGIRGSGASMRNCTIVDSSVTYYTGNQIGTERERFDGAAITIINGNNSFVMDGGYVYNTAIANVSRPAYRAHYQPSGSSEVITNMVPATNCANWNITFVYRNWHYADVYKHFQHCATEDLTPINDTCYTDTRDSFFVPGKVVPRVKGPLYDNGLTLEGQSTQTDFLGRPRVFGKAVDIGCCESQHNPGFLIYIR